MTDAKRKKLLLAVAGIGLAAVVVDRVVLSDSAPASTAAVVPVADETQDDADVVLSLEPSLLALADAAGENSRPLSTLFGLTETPTAAATGTDGETGADPGEASAAGAEDFVVTAISSEGRGHAVINGRILRVGETLGGITLVSVDGRRVSIRTESGVRVLNLR